MPSFALVIEYLTGYAVATHPTSREQAEWPPHPARVFMALAAAHFEADGTPEQKQAERAALEWLATLAPPDLVIPPHAVRDVLSVYVPVNDQAGGDALVRRSRQPRTFPRVHVGSEPVRLIYRVDPELFPAHMRALEGVCRQVTRVGHSSSLVWMRIERSGEPFSPTLVPDDGGTGWRLRVTDDGVLGRLKSAYNQEAVEAYAALEQRIGSSTGPAKRKLKEEQQTLFPLGRPTSQRPVISVYQGYRESAPPAPAEPAGVFDPNFIVLSGCDEATGALGLESAALVTDAMRGTLMQKSPVQPVPAWAGGHESNGDKLQSQPHLAIIPLPFVGRPGVEAERFADGHLMGLGICIPRAVPPRERAGVLSKVLFDEKSNAPRQITLTLGRAGKWVVQRETGSSPKRTLRPSTYTQASRVWASVTPVLLDRMPKADRVQDPVAWREEVAGIIAGSCRNSGLPSPVAIRVEKTPFFLGSLRAMPGQGGFPQLRRDRFQVHALIEFAVPVSGPVLIGAGRFRGYGLMRPWRDGQ